MKSKLRMLVTAIAIAGAITPALASAQEMVEDNGAVCFKTTKIYRCDKSGNCVLISTTEPIQVDCPN